MKQFIIKSSLSLLLALGALSFSSCSDDNEVTGEAIIYINNGGSTVMNQTVSVTHLAALNETTIEGTESTLYVGSTRNLGADATIYLGADEAAVETYNTENGTAYTLLPESNYVIEGMAEGIVMPAGESLCSLPMSIVDIDNIDGGIYLLPLAVQSVQSKVNARPSINFGLMYIVVTINKVTKYENINPEATEFTGTPIEGKENWIGVGTPDIDKIINGSTTSGDWNDCIGMDSSVFQTIDLGSEHNVEGIAVYIGMSWSSFSTIQIDTSKDGVAWDEQGKENIKSVTMNGIKTAVAKFYSPVTCSHIRFKNAGWGYNYVTEVDIFEIN